jgi:hypothetical protein
MQPSGIAFNGSMQQASSSQAYAPNASISSYGGQTTASRVVARQASNRAAASNPRMMSQWGNAGQYVLDTNPNPPAYAAAARGQVLNSDDKRYLYSIQIFKA